MLADDNMNHAMDNVHKKQSSTDTNASAHRYEAHVDASYGGTLTWCVASSHSTGHALVWYFSSHKFPDV